MFCICFLLVFITRKLYEQFYFFMLPFFNSLLFEIALYYTKHVFFMRETLSYQIQRIMNLQKTRMLTASSFHAWNA